MAKWLAYYSVLSDLPGLVIGAALVYAFVRGKRWLLYGLTFFATLGWPAAYYEGLILTLCSPFRSAAPQTADGARRLALGLAIALAIAFTAWALYLVEPRIYATVKFNVHAPMRDVIPVAVTCGAAYLFFGTGTSPGRRYRGSCGCCRALRCTGIPGWRSRCSSSRSR